MCTHQQQKHCSVSGPVCSNRDDHPARETSGMTSGAQLIRRGAVPALLLLMGMFIVLVTACGQQPAPEVLAQMQARLDQLEQKITALGAKDAELTDLVNDGKATNIKLEEAVAAISRQIEKNASPPSGLAAQKSAPPSAMVPPGKKQHTVARGETLYSIGKRYGMSVDELRRLNRLSQGQPIQAGQKLVVAQ